MGAKALPNIVEECRRPELTVIGVPLRVLEHLQRVEQGIPFRVPNGILLDALDGFEEVSQLLADVGR